jgi:hypothetical protein
MALILEDALTLYVFEDPEQEEALRFLFSEQVSRKDPEALILRLKGYKSLYAFVEWCVANKYLTKADFNTLRKAYNNLVNTLCAKMNHGE